MKRNQLLVMLCCFLYTVSFLLLPYLRIFPFSTTVSGARMIGSNLWMALPILVAFCMAFSCVVLRREAAAAICGVGAFFPMLLYAIFGDTSVDLNILLAAFSYTGIAHSTMGSGIYLCLLFGFAAALFCLLPETLFVRNVKKPKPGLVDPRNDNW